MKPISSELFDRGLYSSTSDWLFINAVWSVKRCRNTLIEVNFTMFIPNTMVYFEEASLSEYKELHLRFSKYRIK